jgi:hypothetical protein
VRRRLPGILVVLASIVLLFAGLAVWVARQALDTDDWVDTSSALIRHPAIQQETASYVADQLIDQAAVTAKLRQILPPRAQALAAPAAGAIPEIAERTTLRALRSGAFQKLWEQTNRVAHQQLVRLVKGDTNAAVVFDLRPMLGQVATRIGLGPGIVDKMPPDRGRVELVRPDELVTARKIARGLRALAIVLVLLAIILEVAAVWAAHDRRRTLMHAGLGILFAGLLLLILRRVLGSVVVGELTSGGASEPAAQATWDIGTSLLRQIAASVVGLGLVVMTCAWLAGPARWAARGRRWMGPTLRDQPIIAFTVALGALLVLLLVGIIPGSGRPVLIGIYIVLVVGGVIALRRQVQAEAGN